MNKPFEIKIEAVSLNRYRCNNAGLSGKATLAKFYNKGKVPRYRRIMPNASLSLGDGIGTCSSGKHPAFYGLRFDANDSSPDLTMCPDDQIADHCIANALLTAIGYRPVSAYSKRPLYYNEPDDLMKSILESAREGMVKVENRKYYTQQLQKTIVSDTKEYSSVQVKVPLRLRNGTVMLAKGHISKKMLRLAVGDAEYSEYMAIFEQVSGRSCDEYPIDRIVELLSFQYPCNNAVREFFDRKSAILDAMDAIEKKACKTGLSSTNSACTNMLFYNSVRTGTLTMKGVARSMMNMLDCYRCDPVLYACVSPIVTMGTATVAVFDASVVIPADRSLVDRLAEVCYFSRLEGGPITEITIHGNGETNTDGWKPVFVTPFTLEHGMPSKEDF